MRNALIVEDEADLVATYERLPVATRA